MKFLPENKKKKKWSVAILVIAVIGIIYVNFFTGPKAPAPAPIDPATNVVPDATGGGDLAGEPAASSPNPAAAPVSGSKLTPYGNVIDTSILNDPVFKSLREAPELILSEGELGRENLFSP